MGSKIVGLDLDGVLSSIAEEFCNYYNQRFGASISASDIRSYKAEEWTGRSKEEIDDIFVSTSIFETVQPIPKAVSSLEVLKANGWTIHIVTHRPWYPALQDVTKKWLKDHGFAFDFLHFSQTSDKAPYVVAHGIPLFVEDSRENAQSLSQVCKRVYLLDYTYNRGDLPTNVLRVETWKQILSQLI